MMAWSRIFILAWLIATLLSPIANAQDPGLAQRFQTERALVAQLTLSRAPQDQRKLAELYRDGLIFSATNPVRKAERDAAILAYRRAIDLGDHSASSIVPLGRLLLREDGGVSFQSVVPDLQRLALGGNGDALYLLATDALENQKRPLADVIPRLEAAALSGSLAAITDLGALGQEIGETLKATLIHHLTERASRGNSSAALSLFKVYSDGILVPAEPQRAIAWLTKGADAGHLAALEQLGAEYLSGQHVSPDPARAAELYQTAAQAGSRVAALALGNAAITGSGLPVSDAQARTWLQRASEAGTRQAAVLLSNLDLKLALAFQGEPAERSRLIEAALSPIASDPQALADLAGQHWRSAHSDQIGPVLIPMLEAQALKGKSVAALALNAWLEANGRPLPDHVARALITSLRKAPLVSVAFSNFTVANLALNGRILPTVLSKDQAIRLLFRAADDDVGQAMLRLGQLYRHGDQLARSESFARRWFLKAQEHLVERAFWEMADLQVHSPVGKERQAAQDFYRQQIDAGDPRAGIALVNLLLRESKLDGVSLERALSVSDAPADRIALASLLFSTGQADYMDKAQRLLTRLDIKRLPTADLVALGRLRSIMASNAEEAANAVALLNQAAASGAPVAKTTLAATYLSSVAYRDEAKRAIVMLQEVLNDNPSDPEARLVMARAYMMGLGIDRDAAKAEALIAQVRAENGFKLPKASLLEADWLAFSAAGRDPAAAEALLAAQAARGSAAAQRALGEYALNGFGRSIRPDMAAGLIHGAARAGDKEAMATLGHMLLNGYGVSQSREGGIDWLSRAANAGNTSAMYELSRIMAQQQGSNDTSRAAVEWLKKAAEKSHPNAAYQLGLAYLAGDWVEKDVSQAAAWFERSARAGNLLAGRTLKAVLSSDKAEALATITNTSD